MEIRKIENIIPYDKNPRDNEPAIEQVLESLKLHGQVKPIVLSAKGFPFEQEIICAGHTTFEALKKFGAQEIKVVVKEFDNEKSFLDYNIRDNKTSEFAEWDEKTLAELGIEFDLDLAEMGFDFDIPEDATDENEINDLSDDLENKYEISVECENEEEQEKIYNQLLEMGLKCRLLTL